VPSQLTLTEMSKYLRQIVPSREYVLAQELFDVLKGIHDCVGKQQLKEKEKWNIVMSSKLLPENNEITGDQLAFALGRGFKYVLLRKS
jgi:hypothetical protein